MQFGILQRYVIGEVLRAFAMALTAITAIFVLFMVMAEAAKVGLPLFDILKLVPFIMPASLPYTIPVALLFAVSVVYGRISADNEVIALKAAGQSAMTILWPAVLVSAMLALMLFFLGREIIPRCNNTATRMLFSDMEDTFYMYLKSEHEFSNPKWPFLVIVKDVQDRTLIDATFKHRTPGSTNPNDFDMVLQAKRARVNFDLDAMTIRIELKDLNGTMTVPGKAPHRFKLPHDDREFPIPDSFTKFEPLQQVQELTAGEIAEEQAGLLENIENERRFQAVSAAMHIASGRVERVDWDGIHASFSDYRYWQREYMELETEKQLRVALAVGVIGFVLLGAPVGIRGAKRDFLSSFIFSFLPIIILYYPAILLGINAGKEGLIHPTLAVWLGNLGLFAASGFLIRPVLRH